jgi:hypothetical protein
MTGYVPEELETRTLPFVVAAAASAAAIVAIGNVGEPGFVSWPTSTFT